ALPSRPGSSSPETVSTSVASSTGWPRSSAAPSRWTRAAATGYEPSVAGGGLTGRPTCATARSSTDRDSTGAYGRRWLTGPPVVNAVLQLLNGRRRESGARRQPDLSRHRIRTSARADLESHRHLTVVCPRAKVPTPREVPNMDGDQVAEESQSRSQRQRRDRGDQRRGEAELLKRDEVHEAGADADEAPQDDEEAH